MIIGSQMQTDFLDTLIRFPDRFLDSWELYSNRASNPKFRIKKMDGCIAGYSKRSGALSGNTVKFSSRELCVKKPKNWQFSYN